MQFGINNNMLREPTRFQPQPRFSWNRSGPAGFTSMMMMTNERKIWEAALLLVRRHGNEAAMIAEREAERLKASDDELTCGVLCWIARSTAELLRAHPGAGERVH